MIYFSGSQIRERDSAGGGRAARKSAAKRGRNAKASEKFLASLGPKRGRR